MKNKLLIIPNNYSNIASLLERDIYGLIIPLTKMAVGYEFTMNLEEIKNLDYYDKKIYLLLNKSMTNNDINPLKELLKDITKMNIQGIIFSDVAILNLCQELPIEKELIINQEHLNASIYSHQFFHKYLDTSFITSDITMEEIKEIKNISKMKIMYQVYGFLPIFYSKRFLLSNYFTYINQEKEDNFYYLKHQDDYYPIYEDNNGTIIYPKDKINLINHLDELKELDYLVINGFNNTNQELLEVIDSYLNNKKNNQEYYEGFYDTKTIYRVKNNE